MNRFSIITTAFFLAIILSFSSCGSSKRVAYFQPIASDSIPSSFATIAPREAVIVPDDMLAIIVSGLDPAAVTPFNLPAIATIGAINESTSMGAGGRGGAMLGYLVDKDGNIEFPVLGTLKVGGLAKSEAIELIRERLEPYLKDPIITIRFMNFRVSVLGEVARPGSFIIGNEKINLLELLAMAGDLTILGKRENVLVIRENENGVKSSVRIDLTTNEAFRSPFFYLQQNDIVYVEPNKTRVMGASYARQNLPFFISTISALASTTAVIIALTNR